MLNSVISLCVPVYIIFIMFSRSPQTTANTMGNVSPDSSLRDQETGDKDIMEKLVSPTKPVEGGERGEDKEVKKDEETQSISMILPRVNLHKRYQFCRILAASRIHLLVMLLQRYLVFIICLPICHSIT